MNCIIPGKNIKVFARAIHSLAKIGEELYIESLKNGFELKTVNSSRSAFGSFLFDPRFFEKYQRSSDDNATLQQDDHESLRCKIGMTSCMNIFKSASTIEKTVEKCQISLNMKDDRLLIKMYCRHGIVKTHNLTFIECESLNAIFNSDNCENSLISPSKMLCDAVIHFQSNQEEVTLVVSSEKISFKNYIEESDLKKQMVTEVKLHRDEFDVCDIGISTEITFCLKELRAILTFVEATNLPLKINFDTPGKPMSCLINSEGMLEATFVLATLAGDDFSNSQLPPSAKQTTSQNKTRRSSHNKNTNADDSVLVEWDDMTMAEVEEMSLVEASVSRIQYPPAELRPQTSSKNNQKLNVNKDNSKRDKRLKEKAESDEDYNSPVIAIQPCINIRAPNIDMNSRETQENSARREESEEEEDDFIPGTPPSKKFKSLLFGNSQSSTTSEKPAPAVLCLDTDDEDD